MPSIDEVKKAKLIQPADPTTRRIYWLNHFRTKREDGEAVELRPTPEQLAVAVAKCSRSSTPFDQNVDDVSLEKAAEFHEKWVVGYGHSSVAEHAVASVAFQNIPQTIIKILEDNRLASFTEVSSRYQVFTRQRVGIPKSLAQSQFADRVNQLFDHLYNLYDECYALLDPIFRERQAQGDMPDAAYKATIKAMTCDRVRYLLPAAALAALGMTANARVWEKAIIKLLSSADPLAQQIGDEIKSVLRGFASLDRDQALKHFPLPTLLKYADPSQYMAGLPSKMTELASEILAERQTETKEYAVGATAENPVVCTYDDNLTEMRISSALLSRYAKIPMEQALNIVSRDKPLQEKIIKAALEERGPHDIPPREFEHAWFQHEIVMDYGAWRDIQRHRICTQTNQPLGTDLGFDIPDEIGEIGKAKEFAEVMDEARQLNRDILAAGMVAEAQYVVPMAYRRRLLVSWNLRELFHFIELRSGKKGHPSYRRIAQEIWRLLDESHHMIASFIRVDLSQENISTLGAKPKGF
ncbi:MAG: FAD-dependent thymidylate synthase [Patescibacteria group bacterium]|nr:FAD-dependent thymidylate synthase [Patescibacteria group bacterium]